MGLWLADAPLVLASKSAIRRQLLEAAGVPVEVQPADVDERAIEQAAGPASAGNIAGLLATEKARTASARALGRLVLGADQTLGFQGRVFSKALDMAAARAQLKLLRGQTHTLHAAIAIARDGDILFAHTGEAHLTMREFSDSFLDRYLESVGESVLKSVGGYQLEAAGIHLFSHIEGEHSTILGLPLLPLLDFLRTQESLAC